MRRMPDGTTRAFVTTERHQVGADHFLGARADGRAEHDPGAVADRPMNARTRLRALRGVDQRYRIDRRLFEALVAEAIADLPEPFRTRLSNVAVVVEEWPAADSDGCEHQRSER